MSEPLTFVCPQCGKLNNFDSETQRKALGRLVCGWCTAQTLVTLPDQAPAELLKAQQRQQANRVRLGCGTVIALGITLGLVGYATYGTGDEVPADPVEQMELEFDVGHLVSPDVAQRKRGYEQAGRVCAEMRDIADEVAREEMNGKDAIGVAVSQLSDRATAAYKSRDPNAPDKLILSDLDVWFGEARRAIDRNDVTTFQNMINTAGDRCAEVGY